MGCGGSTAPPEEILADPGNGATKFMVKSAGMMSSHYNVYTGDGDKKLWLFIRNDSGWFDAESNFTLENFVREGGDRGKTLASVTVLGEDVKIKREVEYSGDSDDSDYSDDDLFNFDDEEKVKVKLKWTIKRTATFKDNSGKKYATLKVKMKGKSKAEAKMIGDDDSQTRTISSETKLKKVYYTLEMDGVSDTKLEFENGHWSTYDRSWSCPAFSVVYDSKWGTDEVAVDTSGMTLGGDALAVGFTVGYYFHPSMWVGRMNSKAEVEANSILQDSFVATSGGGGGDGCEVHGIDVRGTKIPRHLLKKWVEAAHLEIVDGNGGKIGELFDSGQLEGSMISALEPLEGQVKGDPNPEMALYQLEVSWGVADGPPPGGPASIEVNGVAIPRLLLDKWVEAAHLEFVDGHGGKIGELFDSGQLSEDMIKALEPFEEPVKSSDNKERALYDLESSWGVAKGPPPN